MEIASLGIVITDPKIIDEIIMIILTAIIAASVFWQARITYQAEKRNEERRKPKVGIILAGSSYSRYDTTTEKYESRKFEGFQATNIGHIDVTITSMFLEYPIRDKPEEYGTTSRTGYPEKIEFEGKIICDPCLPRRLRPGDSVQSLYSLDDLENMQRSHETGKTIRLRPKIQDSIGNEYHGPWMIWESNSNTSTSYGDPGLGYITPEEAKKRLEKDRRRKRWKKW